MKNYDTKFIKQYIEEHKDEIDSVECGMREDWFGTAETVYENGKFCGAYDWESHSIRVGGICGSCWATPIMVCYLKNGDFRHVECYMQDEKEASASQIAELAAWIIRR